MVHDDNSNRIAEHDAAGAVLREYIWLDGRPLAVIEGGQTYWLSWDQIGRPVMATDSTGTVVWAASYLPFGGIREVSVDTGALTQDLRFPGQWFQAETGLHQNWHRDYDPTTGRYLQADPLGLVDGPSVYGYARQNPVRFTDPTGQFAQAGFCLAGPIGCTVAAVITVGAGIVAITDPFDLTSPTPTPRPNNSDDECEDDDCQEIYRKIRERVNELKERLADLQENRHNLPLYGQRMTIESHINEYFAKQRNLRRLIGEARQRGVIIMTKKPTFWRGSHQECQGIPCNEDS